MALVPNSPNTFEAADHGEKLFINEVIAGSENAPLEVTLNWATALKP